MPAPTAVPELLDLIQKSGVIDPPKLAAYVQQLREQSGPPADAAQLAALLVRDGFLTNFQAEQFLQGKWKRFTIGKYKVLEKLGSGGMGQVYLCEHKLMRRKVAIKVLPTAKAEDPSSLERFHREARAVAALDHPNLVRAFDIDQDGELHFLVMEYVDGASLQEIVKKTGTLDVARAAYYVYQTAAGLQYAYEVAGLIHRDVKPANIMVDRQGQVKLLDMGLARFFNDEEDVLTKKYDETVLGTADYLSPEQGRDSHEVDIRADIYSLGATFYFLLTGHPPFPDGSVAQKLIWHQTRKPKSVRLVRHEVPEGIEAIIERMMMKDPAARYQTPAELAGALAPYVPELIAPPADEELPKLSPAAGGPTGAAPAQKPSGRWAVPPIAPAVPRPAAPPAALKVPPAWTAPAAQAAAATPRPRPAAPLPVAPPRAEANPFAHLFGGFEPPAERPQQNVYATAASRAAAASLPAPAPPAPPPPATKSGKGLWVAVVVAIMMAVAAGAGAAWWVTRSTATPPAGPRAADVTEPKADGPAARRLVVAADRQRGEFRTIKDALAKARPGDEVLLLDPVHEEPDALTLKAGFGNGLTIASGLADGKPVTWRLPPNKAAEWLIEVNGCEGVRLKGLVLDGRGLVDAPLRMSGPCPGAAVEDVLVQKFRKVGVKLANCGGEPGRPVTLRRVRATAAGAGEADAALVLFANANMTRPKANEYVAIRDCVFDGPFKAAVVIDGAATDVTVEACRLDRAAEGVRCAEPKKDQPVHVKFAGNTFADMKDAAVAVAAAPDDARSHLLLRQNLFVKCGAVLRVDKGPPRQFVAAEVNGRDRETRDGQLPKPAGEYAVEFVSTDPSRDDFLTYRKNVALANAGLNQTPIGVPAK